VDGDDDEYIDGLVARVNELEAQVELAVKALEQYADEEFWMEAVGGGVQIWAPVDRFCEDGALVAMKALDDMGIGHAEKVPG
jgi:hypothetical protein